jgi:glycosyltransferase 2 family protein
VTPPTTKLLEPTGTRGGARAWLRRNAQLIVGLAISAWSIWQLGRAVDPAEVGQHLEHSNWGLLAVCVLSVPATMVLKVIRWRYLFARDAIPPFAPLLSALYIGYLMNTVLPARVGEFVRAYLIGRQDKVGTPAALATIVLEKLLDLGTLAIMLVVLILSTPLPDWVTPIAYTSAAALVLGLLVLGGMLLVRRRVIGLVELLERRLPVLERFRLASLAASFLDGLAGLGRRETLPGLLFWSAAVWVGATLTMWTGIVGVGVPVGLSAVVLTLVVTNIGMAVPSAPGYVGVFHGLVVLSLQPFGVDPSHALGAALILHAIVFGTFVVGGLWFLLRGGHSLGGLRDASGH